MKCCSVYNNECALLTTVSDKSLNDNFDLDHYEWTKNLEVQYSKTTKKCMYGSFVKKGGGERDPPSIKMDRKSKCIPSLEVHL